MRYCVVMDWGNDIMSKKFEKRRKTRLLSFSRFSMLFSVAFFITEIKICVIPVYKYEVNLAENI